MKECPQGGWKHKRDSYSVLSVLFKDGNTRLFYSLDWNSTKSKHRDHEKGYERFRKKIKEWAFKIDKYWLKKNDSEVHHRRTLIYFYQEGKHLIDF